MEDRGLVGPDLTVGVRLEELEEGRPLLGHAGGEAVMLVRQGGEVWAIGATCTHYGGPLAEGLVVGETVRCPWHHACFSLRTGEALGAPALNPVARWQVEVREGRVVVGAREEAGPLWSNARRGTAPEPVVIVGAGAAGSAAAEMLRREGYEGRLVLVDPDEAAPYDRPNLSKDYLAGAAPEEWIPLRPEGFHAEHGIERIVAKAERLDAGARELALSDGRTLRFGSLLLATGSWPIRLRVPGADLPHVHVLRSLADCRSIIAAAENARRAVVIGASFIGMEVAASLRARGLEVSVVAPESVPFERTLGRELGAMLRALHEEHGVVFRLGRTAAEIRPDVVRLDDGSELPADLVVVGIGVRPDTSLAEAAGLAVDHGILVDARLETSVPGIFAAGDIARFPDARTGELIRVEHWVLAQRHGQAAARSILGREESFTDPPFFWTRQYDVSVTYVGHAAGWDAVVVDGDVSAHDAEVTYRRGGRTLAVATVGRPMRSLEAEAELEAEAAGATSATGSAAPGGGVER